VCPVQGHPWPMGVYMAAKNMSRPGRNQCVQQRLLEVLTFFGKVFISTDCPGRVCESVLEWSMSPYKLI